MNPVRVRFAPSPTGPLHLGGVRTALYNYLLVKKHGGQFIIRVEDTDQTRFTPGAEEHMLDALAWLGLEHDEGPIKGGDYGPYRQSERKSIYEKYAQQLVKDGRAYYAFDTADELDAMRARRKEEGIHSPKYDHEVRLSMRNSLTLSADETRQLIDKGENVTLRLLVEPGETITFDDVVRGQVSFQSSELDDKILMKSDGMPTYHMANIIDDYSMRITHVIRGEDWLSSTAHHILLYRAFGWEDHIPEFIHLPLILKPSGKGKLSKRDGSKFGFPSLPTSWNSPDSDEFFEGYREAGFLPSALNNFLAFLGWNPGTEQEIFDMDALADAFSLDQIVKSGARFDYEKAKWFNQQFIIKTDNAELARIIRPDLSLHGVDVSDDFLHGFIDLMKERVQTTQEFWETGHYFFQDPMTYEEKMVRKKYKIENRNHFEHISDQISQANSLTAESCEQLIKSYISEQELKFGDIMPILRLAVSGTMKGPDLFGMIALLGGSVVGRRLATALDHFDKIAAAKNKE